MQTEAYFQGAAEKGSQAFEEVQLFIKGNYIATPSWKRMGRAYRKMRDMSENWERWAKLVPQRSHLNMY
jgi:hypothetical protein